jgi:lysozyme
MIYGFKDPVAYSRAIEYTKDNEGGHQLKPYRCSAGKLTIGVGHNLEDKGIPISVSKILYGIDRAEVINHLLKHDWFVKLNDVRKSVIFDMAFNMGYYGLLKFKRMIAAIVEDDFITAAKEIKNSSYYKQVYIRAKRNMLMMKTGEWFE